MGFPFALPWGRSNIRLTGRFAVQWLKGFERVQAVGEQITAYELVASFPEMPPKAPIRVLIDVNGRKLAARIALQKLEAEKAPFKCRCKFTGMGARELRDLTEMLENAPDPPYKRERVVKPKRSPLFRRPAAARSVSVAPEIERKLVDALVAQRRLAEPAGNQRPLLAVKSADDHTEDGVEGKRYRIKSRRIDSHGIAKTWETVVFLPAAGGDPIVLD